ncbi:MAG: homoserine dehydrogenase [Oscillospiraceae bacterium]|jgi:homoserine dehydrogenase|nr:homoserine dehydrogenase [Oscillospiraceae bacterium]
MIKAAILGFGVVGCGVYEVLKQNSSQIKTKCEAGIEIKYILDIRKFPGAEYEDKVTDDFAVIENDPEIKIVIETIGGAGAAYDFTRRALERGKHVVTSNKELVATHGYELLSLAEEKNVNYLFEASVGGGIPIIRPIIQCLSANEITEIIGILNGTTNYILTMMINAGMSFEQALELAKSNGYAERNPASDIEGVDAGRKIAILASLASGHHIYPEQVVCEGIMEITLDDVRYAAEAGMVIKLLGRYKKLDGGKICVYVAPHLIGQESMLSGVSGVFNGIIVRGNAVGEVMFYGRGAGDMPTASAVVADVIDAARHIDKTKNKRLWGEGGAFTQDSKVLRQRYYIRAEGAANPAGEPSDAERLFGRLEVISGGTGGMSVFITEEMDGCEFEKALDEYKKSAMVLSCMRVLG